MLDFFGSSAFVRAELYAADIRASRKDSELAYYVGPLCTALLTPISLFRGFF